MLETYMHCVMAFSMSIMCTKFQWFISKLQFKPNSSIHISALSKVTSQIFRTSV